VTANIVRVTRSLPLPVLIFVWVPMSKSTLNRAWEWYRMWDDEDGTGSGCDRVQLSIRPCIAISFNSLLVGEDGNERRYG
jgi:hypothetical protein